MPVTKNAENENEHKLETLIDEIANDEYSKPFYDPKLESIALRLGAGMKHCSMRYVRKRLCETIAGLTLDAYEKEQSIR